MKVSAQDKFFLLISSAIMENLTPKDINSQQNLVALEKVGYVSPGYGFKGKRNAITSDHDVLKVYEEHCSKCCEIRLWCLCTAQEAAKP